MSHIRLIDAIVANVNEHNNLDGISRLRPLNKRRYKLLRDMADLKVFGVDHLALMLHEWFFNHYLFSQDLIHTVELGDGRELHMSYHFSVSLFSNERNSVSCFNSFALESEAERCVDLLQTVVSVINPGRPDHWYLLKLIHPQLMSDRHDAYDTLVEGAFQYTTDNFLPSSRFWLKLLELSQEGTKFNADWSYSGSSYGNTFSIVPSLSRVKHWFTGNTYARLAVGVSRSVNSGNTKMRVGRAEERKARNTIGMVIRERLGAAPREERFSVDELLGFSESEKDVFYQGNRNYPEFWKRRAKKVEELF